MEHSLEQVQGWWVEVLRVEETGGTIDKRERDRERGGVDGWRDERRE